MICMKKKKKSAGKLLDVGCGLRKISGAVGIDIKDADIIHDLDTFPYPIKSDSFENIYSRHCLEHLENFEGVMTEFHRITKKNGLIEIIVPFYSAPGAYYPCHKKFFNYNSFNIFTKDSRTLGWEYSNVKFMTESIRFNFYAKNIPNKYNPLKKILFFIPTVFANSFPNIYQRLFANIFPAYELDFVLRPVK